MVTVNDIKRVIEDYANPSLAEDFDNVGLLFGHGEQPVKKVLLSLDVDESIAREAKEKGADMIVSHHPVIFNPVKSITDATSDGRMLLTLGESSIAVLSAHTNMDKASGGLNDLMVKKLGLKASSAGAALDGCIRICDADESLGDLAEKLKKEYGAPIIRFTGDKERKIKRVGLCTGGGRSMIYDAINAGCDCYISGDLSYSDIRTLVHSGVDFIEIGHYYSERCVTEIFERIIKNAYPEISTIISEEMDVFLNIF